MATTTTTTTPTTTTTLGGPHGLDEELPPAYTPNADVGQGETTVEFGPQRPFQPPPVHASPVQPPQQQQQQHPQHQHYLPAQPQLQSSVFHQSRSTPSLWRQLTEVADTIATHLTGYNNINGNPGYPGQHIRPNQTGTSYLAPPLPPRRPTSMPPAPLRSSDFARDFYSAGTSSQSASSPAREQQSTPTQTLAASPVSPPSTSESLLPPPTTTPTPGRVLLRDGKLLVYPMGFMCPKCKNTGYKHADPSHPCKKCWSKHAKPFSGPLAFAYTHSQESADGGQQTFQAALPVFGAPRSTAGGVGTNMGMGAGGQQRRCSSFPPLPPPPPQHPAATNMNIPPFSPPPPLPPSSPMSMMGRMMMPPPPRSHHFSHHPRIVPLSSTSSSSFFSHNNNNHGYGHDPNSVVYTPGDPRLGGRLCWKCGGSGRETVFLILDEGTCPVCAGVGRVFFG